MGAPRAGDCHARLGACGLIASGSLPVRVASPWYVVQAASLVVAPAVAARSSGATRIGVSDATARRRLARHIPLHARGRRIVVGVRKGMSLSCPAVPSAQASLDERTGEAYLARVRPRREPYLSTRYVRCVTPGASTTPTTSSSVPAGRPASSSRTPPPSSTGTSWIVSRSSSPTLSACCTTLAPISETSFSPAAARACSTAASIPLRTNVYGGAPGSPAGTLCGGSLVSTNSAAPGNGPLPCHARAISYVRLPETTAPTRSANPSNTSALVADILNVG